VRSEFGQLVEWSQLVSRELLLLRPGTVREPRGRGASAVGSRYQKTGEDQKAEKYKCALY
jgi:hypothetical protein